MAWVLDWLFGLIPPEEDNQEQIAEQEDINREQEQFNLIARRGEEVLASVPALPPLQSVYPEEYRSQGRLLLGSVWRAFVDPTEEASRGDLLQDDDEAPLTTSTPVRRDSPPPPPPPRALPSTRHVSFARVAPSSTGQRSGMVLPCACCPPSPSLASLMCPGMPVKGWSPTWEEAEGGVIVIALNLLLWGVLWALFGQAAGPLPHAVGSYLDVADNLNYPIPLFAVSAPFYVIILSLAGHAIGVLVGALTPFPPMYGMLLMPAVVSNLGIDELEVLDHVRGDIAALIVFASMGVFVARAGIDVELSQLQSSSGLVLALAFLPLLSEVAVVTLTATYVLDISWRWAFLLATLTTPMSPLVVMWTALQLRHSDLGTPTAVCSLLLVVCALDWAAGFCLLGVALKCAMQKESWSSIASGFTELISGILLGSVIGFFSIYVPNEHNVHATFYRVEMLLAVNVCFVVMFHYFLGMPAIGYLSAFTTACVASNGWKTLSMDSKKTTLRTMMSLSWLILEPLAMSIVGPHIIVTRLGEWRQLRYIGVLFTGLATRLVISALCCVKSSRQCSERCFICIACIPKGAVQLVSCSFTLSRTLSEDADKAMADVMMDCCTLALLLTGPLGSLLSSLTAPKLLRHRQTRSSFLEVPEPDMSF